jgi:hypothetical protein
VVACCATRVKTVRPKSSYTGSVELNPIIKLRNIDLRFPPGFCVAGILILLALQAAVLHLFGQSLISKTHSLMLWAGDVLSAENSQQLSDWYTPSHIIHGFVFYFALWAIFRQRLTFWQRLAIATSIEVGWEMLENTPMVINHYREQALAQGYFGDSVINSLSDTAAMILGFFLAWRLPILTSVAICIGLELWVGYWIHDNLILNILGFVWTPEFIANWQTQ